MNTEDSKIRRKRDLQGNNRTCIMSLQADTLLYNHFLNKYGEAEVRKTIKFTFNLSVIIICQLWTDFQCFIFMEFSLVLCWQTEWIQSNYFAWLMSLVGLKDRKLLVYWNYLFLNLFLKKVQATSKTLKIDWNSVNEEKEIYHQQYESISDPELTLLCEEDQNKKIQLF